ncbi:tyrosine-type recombinase/integrase [Clostridium sp. SHJSY1]|uniref:tyrosine-type recombinase/integrase n=1 Tax=Clostridium sp. SHJSY1 TaxID=2942483 RepID=UPI0037BEA0BD
MPIYLTSEELKKILEAPDKYSNSHKLQDKTILETFIFTGLRQSELLYLNWKNINFRQRTITILHGKGKNNVLCYD